MTSNGFYSTLAILYFTWTQYKVQKSIKGGMTGKKGIHGCLGPIIGPKPAYQNLNRRETFPRLFTTRRRSESRWVRVHTAYSRPQQPEKIKVQLTSNVWFFHLNLKQNAPVIVKVKLKILNIKSMWYSGN